jgi:hypothetical protein
MVSGALKARKSLLEFLHGGRRRTRNDVVSGAGDDVRLCSKRLGRLSARGIVSVEGDERTLAEW